MIAFNSVCYLLLSLIYFKVSVNLISALEIIKDIARDMVVPIRRNSTNDELDKICDRYHHPK